MGEEMGFEDALKEIKAGRSVMRLGWNGKGMCVRVMLPDPVSDMTSRYLFLTLRSGETVPWLPSQSDIFACDWVKG